MEVGPHGGVVGTHDESWCSQAVVGRDAEIEPSWVCCRQPKPVMDLLLHCMWSTHTPRRPRARGGIRGVRRRPWRQGVVPLHEEGGGPRATIPVGPVMLAQAPPSRCSALTRARARLTTSRTRILD
jgi:hypothetical protein